MPDLVYFLVVTLADKDKADIRPNLYVQGYRPHSSGAHLSVDTRRYGEFVPNDKAQKRCFSDDIVFLECQLYQVKEDLDVELVLKSGDSHDKAKIAELAKRICWERGYQQLSDVAVYHYDCPRSAGYFLTGRQYKVWSMLVGEPTGFELRKRVLIFDYDTGIPAIVEYEDDCFLKA